MKDFVKVISNSGNRQIVLINRLSDPVMWIVNVYKKILFFKKKVESFWFNDEEEALKFAYEYAKKNPE